MRGARFRPKLSELVSFRLTEEEFAVLEERAQEEDGSPGDLVRVVVRQWIESGACLRSISGREEVRP